MRVVYFVISVFTKERKSGAAPIFKLPFFNINMYVVFNNHKYTLMLYSTYTALLIPSSDPSVFI